MGAMANSRGPSFLVVEHVGTDVQLVRGLLQEVEGALGLSLATCIEDPNLSDHGIGVGRHGR
jgi:hypothetical protein